MIELVSAGQLADMADAVNSWVGANTYQPVQISTPLYTAASTIDEPWITGSVANKAQTGRLQVDRPPAGPSVRHVQLAVVDQRETVRDRHGFGAFVQRAAPQLMRWESRYGWTTHGWGQVPEKEASLASVLARMLAAPDAWTTFADCYLAALGQAARADATAPPRIYGSWGYGDNGFRQRERARNLAEWHGLLLERLAGSEAEDRLGRLASHRALGGPDRMFLQARLARQRGDTAAARKLIRDCLRELPGEQDFARFAAEIGTD